MPDFSKVKHPPHANAVIILSDGSVFFGRGFGAQTPKNKGAVGEICFNTGMTGYQETLTDPSYAGQIINFTFPHIGNVGTNNEDMECDKPYALGLIVREDITNESNWRSNTHLNDWLIEHKLTGISGIDTRALTQHIRDNGAPTGVLCFSKDATFDFPALHKQAQEWSGLTGRDLAKEVSCKAPYDWDEKCWTQQHGYTKQSAPKFKVVAIDYGAKRNILRCLANAGFAVTVMPAQTSAADILAQKPDGVFLSNGPGDPAATGKYANGMIQDLIKANMPIFGICLGHQLLAQALGGKTRKMHLGHRGANQPVKDLTTGKVEITSQNHGFEVIADSLPDGIEQTHISLFDGSNEGLHVIGKPIFSVQYHPEASPGPTDSYYLFERFMENIKQSKAKAA